MYRFTKSLKITKLLSLMILASFCVNVIALTHANATPTKSQIQNCNNRYNFVKYRSQILAIYKQNEDKKYQNKRKGWAKSIAYNGRWDPKLGVKVRDNLYELDGLHAKTISELDRQISQYKTLQYQEFDCSKSTKNKVLESKISEIEKSKNTGNALVTKFQTKEASYAQKDFKKSLNKLVKSSFKKRDNFKAPEIPPLIIKSYTEAQ